MPKFIVRVELHEKSPSQKPDYSILHSAMETPPLYFKRSAIIENKKFSLPTAEYFIEGGVTINQVAKMAKDAANSTGFESSILVTEVADLKGVDLKPIVMIKVTRAS